MRYPTIHEFLKWVPPAIGGGLLGVAAIWTEAKDWIAQQVVWGWAQMSSPRVAALTFLGVCAYGWAIIWTGQTPAPVPEALPDGATGAAPSYPCHKTNGKRPPGTAPRRKPVRMHRRPSAAWPTMSGRFAARIRWPGRIRLPR
jgi:hypothetical protein